MRAWEWLLVQMDHHDMPLQGRVLAERLVARRVLRAAVLVPSIVCGQMSPEPCSSHECLAAAWPVTDVVPNRRVRALDMMVEMRSAQKRLLTTFVTAFKDSLVVMRAYMLLQPRRSVEGFCAALEWAEVSLELRRILGGRWRERGQWSFFVFVVLLIAGVTALVRGCIIGIRKWLLVNWIC